MKIHFGSVLVLLSVFALSSQAQTVDPTIVMTGWDQGTWQVTGTNGSVPFVGSVLMHTSIHQTQLNQFAASDPMRPLAEQWNALIKGSLPNRFDGNISGFSSILSNMAVLHGSLQVSLNKDGSIRAMHPVP
jgi:hypothetical protein